MRFDEIVAWERHDAMEETRRNVIFELLEDYGEIPEEHSKNIGR